MIRILDFTLSYVESQYRVLSRAVTRSDLYFDRITLAAMLELDLGSKNGSEDLARRLFKFPRG